MNGTRPEWNSVVLEHVGTVVQPPFFDQPAEVKGFDAKAKSVRLQASGRDLVTRSTYRYELNLTLKDLASILNFIATTERSSMSSIQGLSGQA